MRFLTAVALALVMLWVPVDGVAQTDYRDRLRGISRVDLIVQLAWDDEITEITGMNKAQFTREVERSFELGILRAGLGVESEDEVTTDFDLVCRSTLLATNNGNTIAYHTESHLARMVLPLIPLMARGGVPYPPEEAYEDSFLAIIWIQGGLGIVGVSDLRDTATEIGERCAETFELAWRRANN